MGNRIWCYHLLQNNTGGGKGEWDYRLNKIGYELIVEAGCSAEAGDLLYYSTFGYLWNVP